MDKGILLLAINHPYYGRMAENLAISILATGTKIPIAIAGDQKGLSHIQHHHIFKKVINVPVDYYYENGMNQPIKAKTHLYDLTPFKNTLFLDADMVWLRKDPLEIFNELSDVDFTIKNTGNVDLDGAFRADYSHWTNDLHALKKEHKLTGKYYALSSEVIYFKRNKGVKKIFDTAKKLYSSLKPGSYLPFGGGIPDELLFSISMIKNNAAPHIDGWIPSYWEDAEKRNAPIKDILANYFAYSIGGKTHATFVVNNYNNLVNAAYRNKGYTHPFILSKATEKYQWLPERTHI